LGTTPWEPGPDVLTPPDPSELNLIRLHPRWFVAPHPLWQPVNENEVVQKVRSILRNPIVSTFRSYDESLKAQINLVSKENLPHLKASIDGILVTKNRNIFFWQLVAGKYLFLQDSEGRICYLEP
jgi:hypothetical protein